MGVPERAPHKDVAVRAWARRCRGSRRVASSPRRPSRCVTSKGMASASRFPAVDMSPRSTRGCVLFESAAGGFDGVTRTACPATFLNRMYSSSTGARFPGLCGGLLGQCAGSRTTCTFARPALHLDGRPRPISSVTPGPDGRVSMRRSRGLRGGTRSRSTLRRSRRRASPAVGLRSRHEDASRVARGGHAARSES